MNLNDLLRGKSIDPKHVLVFRHRPHEPNLNKVLPWLAAVKPDVFNAYQQVQRARIEKVMQAIQGTGHVASFIRHAQGKALFIGLYAVGGSNALTRQGVLACASERRAAKVWDGGLHRTGSEVVRPLV